MKPITKRALAFFGALVVMAAIAWLGGYDFDRRGEGVAVYAIFSLGIAAFLASYSGFNE